MAAARDAGWRFVGLGTEAPDGPAATLAGGIALVTGDAAVRQSVMLLLATVPGERVMRPDYGCSLNRLLFEPNDDTTAGLAIHYVRQALRRFEPRVEVLRLDAGPAPDGAGERLHIRLDYRVRASGRADALIVAVPLDGGPVP